MGKNKDNTQANPSQRPHHGSGDRNESAYVSHGETPRKEGVDERYGPDYSESGGSAVDNAPDKTGSRR